jgi:hypothetical protein
MDLYTHFPIRLHGVVLNTLRYRLPIIGHESIVTFAKDRHNIIINKSNKILFDLRFSQW